MRTRRERSRFVASEVPIEERRPLLEAYRKLAGKAVVAHFEALPDAADHPVFKVAAASEAKPGSAARD